MANEQMTIGSVITKTMFLVVAIVPAIITIWIAIRTKNLLEMVVPETPVSEAQIVCFDYDQCLLEINSIWYEINGVVDMDKIVSDRYPTPQPIEIIEEIEDE